MDVQTNRQTKSHLDADSPLKKNYEVSPSNVFEFYFQSPKITVNG